MDQQRSIIWLSGYLSNKRLQEAYSAFCETSRYLTKEEKEQFKSENEPLEISIGLVNIVREYLNIKKEIATGINQFLSSCSDPLPPVITKLVDSEDTLRRLKIILEYFFKDNLNKIVKVPPKTSTKRKHKELDVFDVSQSNASTPEAVRPSKRRRKSLLAPFIICSTNKDKENGSKSIERSANRKELFISSPDTSGKDEDDEDEEDDDLQPLNRATASPISHLLKANSEVRKSCSIR